VLYLKRLWREREREREREMLDAAAADAVNATPKSPKFSQSSEMKASQN
jgi:hypothetical protein